MEGYFPTEPMGTYLEVPLDTESKLGVEMSVVARG
jgi:hypothetical protein